jgi:heme exporter protein A
MHMEPRIRDLASRAGAVVGGPGRPPPAVELRGITRRFGRRWVLRGADVTVAPGDVVALIGRNGSGKTTLLRVIATALRPNHGSGEVFGDELVGTPERVREHVGLLGHSPGIYDDLTALENLLFSQRMAGDRPDAGAALAALDRVGLGMEAEEPARGFSSGMRRRLALARLVMRPPRLLLLDEPFASFDTDGIERLYQFIRERSESGGAVILATHDLPRARAVLTRVIEVMDGRLEERPVAAGAQEASGLFVTEETA